MSNGSIDQTHPEWPSLRQHMLDMGAEIDNLRREVDHLQRESAENEAELAEMTKLMERYYIDWDNADETLARVRELCMQDSWDIKLAGVGFVDVRLVLRALDGAE